MSKTCAICGNKIGSFSRKIYTTDHKHICMDCFDKVFSNTSSNNMLYWQTHHSLSDFQKLLNENKHIDLKEYVKQAKSDNKQDFEENRKIFFDHNAQTFEHVRFDSVDKKVMQDKTMLSEFFIAPYSDIIGYTPIERGHSKNKKHGITRAVVGGVIAGGVGSIVGAATGGKQLEYVDQLGVDIELKNNVHISVMFIKQETKQNFIIKTSYNQYYRICSLLDGILSENSHNTVQKVEASNPKDTIATQIRDLKELADEGILTEEEFNIKKKQLLGL